MNLLTNTQKRDGGFTLLELLIVIAIIAILSIALVFMLNPAETLKKARDAQRISDLKSVKTAIGIFLTSSSTASLDSTAVGTCLTTIAGGTNAAAKIAYSSAYSPSSGVTTAGGSDAVGSFSSTITATSSTSGKVDGSGWIPVNLKALTGGSPLSNLPVDPVNNATIGAAATSSLAYRYACQNLSLVSGKPSYAYEIDAVLESSAYTVDDNKVLNDGGDNANFYETGNSLNILPVTGGTF